MNAMNDSVAVHTVPHHQEFMAFSLPSTTHYN